MVPPGESRKLLKTTPEPDGSVTHLYALRTGTGTDGAPVGLLEARWEDRRTGELVIERHGMDHILLQRRIGGNLVQVKVTHVDKVTAGGVVIAQKDQTTVRIREELEGAVRITIATSMPDGTEVVQTETRSGGWQERYSLRRYRLEGETGHGYEEVRTRWRTPGRWNQLRKSYRDGGVVTVEEIDSSGRRRVHEAAGPAPERELGAGRGTAEGELLVTHEDGSWTLEQRQPTGRLSLASYLQVHGRDWQLLGTRSYLQSPLGTRFAAVTEGIRRGRKGPAVDTQAHASPRRRYHEVLSRGVDAEEVTEGSPEERARVESALARISGVTGKQFRFALYEGYYGAFIDPGQEPAYVGVGMDLLREVSDDTLTAILAHEAGHRITRWMRRTRWFNEHRVFAEAAAAVDQYFAASLALAHRQARLRHWELLADSYVQKIGRRLNLQLEELFQLFTEKVGRSWTPWHRHPSGPVRRSVLETLLRSADAPRDHQAR
jgi:hypothetical protein